MPRLPLLLFPVVAALILAFWQWFGRPVEMPPHSVKLNDPIYCVSFAPFRSGQSPFDPTTRIGPQQVEEDLVRIRKVTDCVRTYATDLGSQHVPPIARKLGMKVYLGIWIGGEEMANRVQIETALSLANRYPDVIRAIIVGNEVLLRRDQSPAALATLIREVKGRTSLPVTYADVWEFWVQNKDLVNLVDFVTIHTLPYWEDVPMPIEKAAAHIHETRKHVAEMFPGKEILIGEVGWPSFGRMREGALPSLSNQARLLADVTRYAREGGYKFNWIEVIDQPWKRRSEGTVGGYWGIFAAGADEPKFRPGAAVSDHPYWREQAAGGVLLAGLVFAVALFAARGREKRANNGAWIGVGAIALSAGGLVGLAIEKLVMESLTTGDWAFAALRLVTMVVIALAAAAAVIREIAMPRLADQAAELFQPRRELGWLMMALFTALIFFALQSAVALGFDPRYRDFPGPTLTIGLVPFLALALLRPSPAMRLPHLLLAGLLGLSVIWTLAIEGLANWQSLWFAATIAMAAALLALPIGKTEAEQEKRRGT